MSTVTNRSTVSLAERGSVATRRLRQTLGLDDLKLLSTALAEVVADESSSNPEFAARVRLVYAELEAIKQRQGTRHKIPGHKVELVPIGRVEGYAYDPFAPVDPEYLFKLYGRQQLPLALDRYSHATLKEASAKIERENPGTKPTNRSRKDSIIEYIVEHVAGPGY